MSEEKTDEVVVPSITLKGGEVEPEASSLAEVQQILDEEYKECVTRCVFYRGIYFGALDHEHLLKLSKILAGRNLNKETNSE